MKLKSPCIVCGEVCHGTRCEECSSKDQSMRIRTKHSVKKSTKSRGYTGSWRRLSERARTLQPWCSDCGTTDDLQADHSPEAWRRYEKGLPLRLVDVDVVCGKCNRKRGAARGKHARGDSKPSNTPQRAGGQP